MGFLCYIFIDLRFQRKDKYRLTNQASNAWQQLLLFPLIILKGSRCAKRFLKAYNVEHSIILKSWLSAANPIQPKHIHHPHPNWDYSTYPQLCVFGYFRIPLKQHTKRSDFNRNSLGAFNHLLHEPHMKCPLALQMNLAGKRNLLKVRSYIEVTVRVRAAGRSELCSSHIFGFCFLLDLICFILERWTVTKKKPSTTKTSNNKIKRMNLR